MAGKTPKRLAASDRDVKRWHQNMARSSRLNADARLRRLNLFCNRTKTTPAKLVRIGKKDAMNVEDILLDHVSWLESQGYAPNYIDGILKSVRAWLAFNYVELKRKIRITDAGVSASIQDESVPTKDELESILNAANTKTGAIIGLMAFAGLRPQVIGNADASDGLRIPDLPELAIEEKDGRQHKAL